MPDKGRKEVVWNDLRLDYPYILFVGYSFCIRYRNHLHCRNERRELQGEYCISGMRNLTTATRINVIQCKSVRSQCSGPGGLAHRKRMVAHWEHGSAKSLSWHFALVILLLPAATAVATLNEPPSSVKRTFAGTDMEL